MFLDHQEMLKNRFNMIIEAASGLQGYPCNPGLHKQNKLIKPQRDKYDRCVETITSDQQMLYIFFLSTSYVF